MRTAFGTVIYQTALEFGVEFIKSLNKQDADFDIVIINDNCTSEQINNLISISKHEVKIKDLEQCMSPGELRIELILYAIKLQYDLLILGDFDDVFMENRVRRIQKNYSFEYTFFYNELYDFEKNNIMKSIPEKTLCIQDIMDYNYLGLSNSALNLRKISVELLKSMKDDRTIVFDWYFFSRILLDGGYGKLIKGTGTYYRIHDNNIAGITFKNVNIAMIEKEIAVKITHYNLMQKYDERFRNKLLYYKELSTKVKMEDFQLCNVPKKEFWWSIINGQVDN